MMMKLNEIFIATVLVAFVISTRTIDACNKGSKSTPKSTTTEKSSHCDAHDQCRDYEQCLNGKCAGVCESELVKHAENAHCTAKGHIPYYKCPEAYQGDPYSRCTKSCAVDENCVSKDICLNNECVYGCESIKCPPDFYCRSVNHKPKCNKISR